MDERSRMNGGVMKMRMMMKTMMQVTTRTLRIHDDEYDDAGI